jgi:hypothetical protein
LIKCAKCELKPLILAKKGKALIFEEVVGITVRMTRNGITVRMTRNVPKKEKR